MTDLSATIDDLRCRLDALPKVDYGRGDFIEQRRLRREAERSLGEYLTATYGARIKERPDANRISMLGISSTSTTGLEGAFHNWIAAAEKKRGARR